METIQDGANEEPKPNQRVKPKNRRNELKMGRNEVMATKLLTLCGSWSPAITHMLTRSLTLLLTHSVHVFTTTLLQSSPIRQRAPPRASTIKADENVCVLATAHTPHRLLFPSPSPFVITLTTAPAIPQPHYRNISRHTPPWHRHTASAND